MCDDFELDELPMDEPVDVAPGVVVVRRGCLALAAAAVAGLSPRAGKAAVSVATAAGEPLPFDQFLRDVTPVAKSLVTDTSRAGQDRYLYTLASFAARLGDVPVPEMRDSGQGAGPGTFIGANPGGDPFTVLHWRMEPGSRIRHHAHVYGNVVTLGLEGQVRVSNFEALGQRDFAAKGTFKVVRTVDQILQPGSINVVNLERNYVHGFVAGPRGGRGLDITTRVRDKQPIPYLDVRAKPVDEALGIFEASWTT